jgi:heme o synthase
MLPVIAGEARTRRSILFYTVLLVAVSLVPLVWLGPVYAAAAIGLGGIFLALAVQATRRRDGASALALFHYSLAYLALLFIAAAVAAVVRP